MLGILPTGRSRSSWQVVNSLEHWHNFPMVLQELCHVQSDGKNSGQRLQAEAPEQLTTGGIQLPCFLP